MISVALNPSDKRLDIVWILLNVLIAHLLQAPFCKLRNSVATHFSQCRVISARGTLDKSVKERFDLWMFINSAA